MPRDHDQTAAEMATALQSAHLHEDVERYVEHFAPEATWITSRGVLVVGRDQLRVYLTGVMPGGLADGSVTYAVTGVAPVGGRATVVMVEQTYRTADGEVKRPGGRHRHTYVIDAAPDDGWWIVAGQNTSIEEAR